MPPCKKGSEKAPKSSFHALHFFLKPTTNPFCLSPAVLRSGSMLTYVKFGNNNKQDRAPEIFAANIWSGMLIPRNAERAPAAAELTVTHREETAFAGKGTQHTTREIHTSAPWRMELARRADGAAFLSTASSRICLGWHKKCS